MAGLAQDENPREMAQCHSQEWLCHWGCRPNPQRRGRLIIWGGPAIHNYDAAEDLRRGGARSVGRRLRVVALTGARSNVGFCDLDFQLVIFVPSKVILPSNTLVRPSIDFTRVLFPEPFGPTIATKSPASTLNDTS